MTNIFLIKYDIDILCGFFYLVSKFDAADSHATKDDLDLSLEAIWLFLYCVASFRHQWGLIRVLQPVW